MRKRILQQWLEHINIQALCAKAQTQVYNDAPYAWLGTLVFGGLMVRWYGRTA